MIDCSTSFQNMLQRDSRTFNARFLNGTDEITGDIKSITIYKGSCGSSEFSPGICFCPYLEATIDNIGTAVEGLELELQIGIKVRGSFDNPVWDYITLGHFTAGKPETNVHRTSFTAQGRIASRMNMPLKSGIWNPTVGHVASILTEETGVIIVFAPHINSRAKIEGPLKNLTGREALALIAATIGGYATETAEGNVYVDKFPRTITASYGADIMLEPPVFADYDVNITGVEVIVSEETDDAEEISYRSGDPVNITISNPYMSESAFSQFAANMIGLQYRPGTIPLSLGDPRLEPWDVLQITDTEENSFVVPCMNIIHTFDGGFETEVIAPGLPDDTQVPSQIDKAVKIALSAEAEAARAKTAAENAETEAAKAARSADAADTSAAQAAVSAGLAATSADNAASSASEAQSQAETAAVAAQNAETQAGVAAGAARQAESEAAEAKAQATQANKYATSALDQLGIVQDVVGVLNWASEHGSFIKTTDTEIQSGKVYFTYDSVTGDYTPVVVPDAAQLTNYYELTVDEAMQSFIMAHLAVTSRGLWVLPSGINTGSVTPESGETIDDARARLGANYKVLLSNTGMLVYDGSGTVVATYGESIRFDSSRPQYIGGEDAYIIFYDSDNDGTPDSIQIGGSNIILGSDKKLQEMLAEVSNTLIYDHTYEIRNGVATFTAMLYRGGTDVKTAYEPEQFTWYYKNEGYEQRQPLLKNLVDGQYVNYGYTISVPLDEMGYGTHIIGVFSQNANSELLTYEDDTLTDSENHTLTGRTPSGESVRVSDLSVATTLYSSEKLMVVGAEDEHLITVQTLQDYLNANLNKQVLFNTTAGWNSQVTLVSDPNTLYVYTDHQRDAQGNAVVGIKAGDGNAYVVDLPFTDAVATEHIADTTRHITAAERAAWNDHMSNSTVHITAAERAAWNEKVRCYYAGTEQLVFTTT